MPMTASLTTLSEHSLIHHIRRTWIHRSVPTVSAPCLVLCPMLVPDTMPASVLTWTKLVVPSIGSQIQSQSDPDASMAASSAAAEALAPASTDSSPRKPCVGKASATACWISRSTSPSTCPQHTAGEDGR